MAYTRNAYKSERKNSIETDPEKIDVGDDEQHPQREMEDRLSIIFIDPVAITRESYTHLLTEKLSNLHIQAVAVLPEPQDSLPDLVLLNIHSERVDSPDVQDKIAAVRHACGPSVRIAVVTDLEQGSAAVAAIQRHELHGYLHTNLGPAIVTAAIRLVLAGGVFIPPELIGPSPHEAAVSSLSFDRLTVDNGQLTSREEDVLQLLRRGNPNKIIAYQLAISESTVKVHLRNIMKKMGVTNRTQVALLTDGTGWRNRRTSDTAASVSVPPTDGLQA